MSKKTLSHLLAVFLFLVFTGCSKSDKYTEATQIILQQYGGSLSAGKGFGVSTSSGGNKFLSVKLTESLALQYGIDPSLIMSNIAYVFFNEMTVEELEKINEIQTIIELPDNNNKSVNMNGNYRVDYLKIVKEKESILKTAVDQVVHKDLNSLYSSFKNETFEGVDTSIINKYSNHELPKIIGEFDKYLFRGFKFFPESENSKKNLLHLSCLILGKKGNMNCSIVVDPFSESEKNILGFDFDQ